MGEQAVTDAAWDETDPLVRISQLRRARDLIDIKIEEAVIEARTTTRWQGSHIDHVSGRANGIDSQEMPEFALATWQQVADALDISRQAAHRKYAHLID